jgi:hypothetical protein
MSDIAETFDDDRFAEYIDIAQQTEKALLVRFKVGDGVRTVWFPKSVCTWDDDHKWINVAGWFVEQEGLDEIFD